MEHSQLVTAFPGGLRAILFSSIAMGAAVAIHVLYRVAEAWAARRRGRKRDYVMLPALLCMAMAIAFAADRVGTADPDFLPGAGFALFLGLAIGQWLPRPGRRSP